MGKRLNRSSGTCGNADSPSSLQSLKYFKFNRILMTEFHYAARNVRKPRLAFSNCFHSPTTDSCTRVCAPTCLSVGPRLLLPSSRTQHAHTTKLNLPARVQDAGCLAAEGRIRCQQGREENLRRPFEVLARGNLSTEGSRTFWVFAGPSGCIFGPVGWPLDRRRGWRKSLGRTHGLKSKGAVASFLGFSGFTGILVRTLWDTTSKVLGSKIIESVEPCYYLR